MTIKSSLHKDQNEICGVCGRVRHNVSHTEDIDSAPEGRDYYEQNVRDRHHFVPTGRYTEGLNA